MNNVPWPIRLTSPILWKSLFWIVRNAAAAARMGWDAGAPVVVNQPASRLKL